MKTKFPTKHLVTKILSFFFILFSALSLTAQTIRADENINPDQKALLEKHKANNIAVNKYFDSS